MPTQLERAEAPAQRGRRQVETLATDTAPHPFARFETFLGDRLGRQEVGLPILFGVTDLTRIHEAAYTLLLAENALSSQPQEGDTAELETIIKVQQQKVLKPLVPAATATSTHKQEYRATVETFDSTARSAGHALRRQIRREQEASGLGPMKKDELAIEVARRKRQYLRGARRRVVDELEAGYRENAPEKVEVDDFFAKIAALSAPEPEAEENNMMKQRAMWHIDWYHRTELRLYEDELVETFGMQPEQLTTMFPGYAPSRRNLQEAHAHRMDNIDEPIPRYDHPAYTAVYNTWLTARVPLEAQMVATSQDPAEQSESLRQYIAREQDINGENSPRLATLFRFAGTLATVQRFEAISTVLSERQDPKADENRNASFRAAALEEVRIGIQQNRFGADDPEALISRRPIDGDHADLFPKS